MRVSELNRKWSKNQLSPFIPLAITLLILIISGIGLGYLAQHSLLTIDRSGVIIRQQAQTNAKGLASIKKDQQVAILNENEGWLKVRYDGNIEGWIPNFLLQQADLPSDQELTAQFDQETAIYPSRAKNEDQALTVPAATYISINSIQGNWAQLTYQGQPTYVPLDAIRLQSTPKLEAMLADQEEQAQAQAAYQKERQALAEKVYYMQTNEAFYLQADQASGYLYQPDYKQEFKRLEADMTIGNDGIEYVRVEDYNGNQGYLKYSSILEPSYSINHRSLPKAQTLKESTILIDPGHGGEDPGTLSSDQTDNEKNYTLPIAMKLKQTLEALGAKVSLTRDQDEFVSLEDRTNQANQEDPDLFLSIHFDSSWDTTLSGTTTYFYHMEDEHLAETLNSSLRDHNLNNIGVAFGNYFILRESQVPSLLLELGFISNDEELSQLRDEAYQQELADSICDGIVNYFKQVQTLAN